MDLYKKVFEVFKSTEHYDFNEIKWEEEKKEDNIFLLPVLDKHSYSKKGAFTKKQVYIGEEHFVKEITNPLYYLSHRRLTLVVTKKDDKVTLKYFVYHRIKDVDKTYYKVGTSCVYYTYNYKKNLLYSGSITNYHKKRKFSKSVRVFDFGHEIYTDFIARITNLINDITEYKTINNSVPVEAFKIFVSNIPNVKYWTEVEALKYSVRTIQKTYLLSRNVKLSDNWWLFSCRYPQPKTKHFKEISDKYLDVIMKLNNLSGDKIKRVLHKLKHNFNPELFQWAVSIFGNDYISQKPDDILVDIFHSKEYPNGLINFEDIKSKKERDNIFNIFMLVVEGEINPQTFYDHFRFYKRIKKFENIKWKSQNYDDFREEHLDWTEKHDFYTKGTYKRIYSESFVSFIETPINDGDDVYYPKVLTTSLEYNGESLIQSNCVKGYIQRPNAFIVSLRKNNLESDVRATIEFRVGEINKNIEFLRVQTLGRFNKTLDNDWNRPIQMLEGKIVMAIHLELFNLPKLLCKIGNSEFIIDSEITESLPSFWYGDKRFTGHLSWNKDLNSLTPGVFINDILIDDF